MPKRKIACTAEAEQAVDLACLQLLVGGYGSDAVESFAAHVVEVVFIRLAEGDLTNRPRPLGNCRRYAGHTEYEFEEEMVRGRYSSCPERVIVLDLSIDLPAIIAKGVLAA